MGTDSSNELARSVTKAIHSVASWPLIVACVVISYALLRLLVEMSRYELGEKIMFSTRDPLNSSVGALLLAPLLVIAAWRSTQVLPGARDALSRWGRGGIRVMVGVLVAAHLVVVGWCLLLWLQQPGDVDAFFERFGDLAAPRLVTQTAWALLVAVGLLYLARLEQRAGREWRAILALLTAASFAIGLLIHFVGAATGIDLVTDLGPRMEPLVDRLTFADKLGAPVTFYLMMSSDAAVERLSIEADLENDR